MGLGIGTCGISDPIGKESKMASPDITEMLEKSKELDRLRKEQEEVLLEINKMHKKLQNS